MNRCRLLLPIVLVSAISVLLAQPAKEGRKYALLIGVSKYSKDQLTPLKYPDPDVEELAQVLLDGGYKQENVVVMTQKRGADEVNALPTAKQVRRQLKLLLGVCREEDSIVIALAGHGVQPKASDESFFCPLDADLEDKQTLISLKELYGELRECKAGLKVLFVDACRNDPFAPGGRNIEQYESVTRPQKTAPPGGVAAFFSCSAGQKAYENSELKHGVFFHFVIKGLKGEANAGKRDNVTLSELVAYVEREVPDFVRLKHEAGQVPELVGNTRGGVPLTAVKRDEREITNSIGMKLVLIPAGKFTMGSPKTEDGHTDDEGPQHEVEITRPFYLGKFEVTRGQFGRFLQETKGQSEAERDGEGGYGYNATTSKFEGRKPQYNWWNVGWVQAEDHPVVNVTWNDAKAFCGWLSQKEGKNYRLPTEAEWEYSCRAKATTRFHSGEDENSLRAAANIADASLKQRYESATWAMAWDDGYPFTAPVGRFKPNGFGLHDMLGNVWEWCQDWYGEKYYTNSPRQDPQGPGAGECRVHRGGSFDHSPLYCRSAYCRDVTPLDRYCIIGFRVLLVR